MEEYFDTEAPLYVPMRFLHDCSKGKDPCLIVTRHPTHWKYFCHRCGLKGMRKVDNLPPGEVVKLWNANRIYKNKPEQETPDVRLPGDFTNDIVMYTPKGYAWLLQYGITDEEISLYNIGYSPYYKRIIFPVYQEDELVYWQGRLINGDDEGPKWLNIKKKGRENIYFYAPCLADKKIGGVVLVEDIVSAIKIARVAESIALLGSYIPDKLLLSLKDRIVFIWLDEDKRLSAMKNVLRFNSVGIKVKLRVTKKDPKCYEEEGIWRILNKS